MSIGFHHDFIACFCFVLFHVSGFRCWGMEGFLGNRGLNMASVFAVTGCVDSDIMDEFDFQSEYLEWEDIACMSEIQQEDDDDELSIDIFPIFSE